MSEKKVSRRGFVKYAAGAVGAVALAGIAYYAGTSQQPTTQPPGPTGAQQNKVHLILYGHEVGGAWDPQLYETMTRAVQNSKYDYRLTVSEGVNEEAVETTLQQAAQTNDLVIASTIVYDGAVKNVAPRFPNVHFVLEEDPIGTDPKSIIKPSDYPDNVIILGPGSMSNNYVAGAIAAKIIGADGKLGFIQALDIPSGVHTGAMFRAGARSVYPNMDSLHEIIGDFVNPVKNRDAIKFMAANGAKAVYIEQDDTSGILEASAQGILAVPSYKDLTSLAPDTIPCCSIWNWEPGFSAILDAHASGNWKQFRADNWYWVMSLANSGLGIGTFGNMVTDDVKAFANKLISDISSGAVTVPYLDSW
jgi:basic membrane protein A